MRKKTLAGLCGLLSLAIVICWNFLIFKIPFGLAPLFAFFVLVPVAAGLTGDTEELRALYFEKILNRFEKKTGQTIKESIIYKKSYSVSDFVNDYNSFKGNAYGLANTLMQTAVFKPKMRSKKVKNLFYTGQLTVPGPGVPPSLISGEVVAGEVMKYFGK